MSRNADCALVGAGIGAAGGIIIEATDNGADAGQVFAGAGVGLVVGGLVGYGVCAIADIGGD